ncbi:uncharacterized protein AMSG_12078 [Thecamonas trahens ATCC 50062]|uniref:Uncharacterized protein n=1 Tax=Thecamonas trahens ATCC 50062 TaxID=461836 RepID=A0A0L0DJY4_THETB|nr:hypothetical protein AMSG_12078 [Thecamonas trahens ATCC 50062]KNC51618.1 hypothetical protein AMSG_12078 [Thecamonas trahens ATCC 50062]|eukprot:XP_013756042.1 hypothetical protein AMSG_12078 [Thecamonas trahens ATCC 50062]
MPISVVWIAYSSDSTRASVRAAASTDAASGLAAEWGIKGFDTKNVRAERMRRRQERLASAATASVTAAGSHRKARRSRLQMLMARAVAIERAKLNAHPDSLTASSTANGGGGELVNNDDDDDDEDGVNAHSGDAGWLSDSSSSSNRGEASAPDPDNNADPAESEARRIAKIERHKRKRALGLRRAERRKLVQADWDMVLSKVMSQVRSRSSHRSPDVYKRGGRLLDIDRRGVKRIAIRPMHALPSADGIPLPIQPPPPVGPKATAASGAAPPAVRRIYLASTDELAEIFTSDARDDLANSSLAGMFINSNNLVGDFSDAICAVKPMSVIGIINAPLVTGSLPDCLADMPNLSKVYLKGLDLAPAPIPPALFNLRATFLSVSAVNMVGELPPTRPATWSNLRYLDFSANSLSGTLPAWLANTPGMASISLRANSFSGIIPPSYVGNPALAHVDLAMNLLTGTIPDRFSANASLSTFDLSYNSLHGELPPSLTLALCASLGNLTLSSNRLTGSLDGLFPPSCSAVHIDFSDNKLTGPIPPELGDCAALVGLFLRSNNLTGQVPASIGSLGSLSLLDLSNNAINGLDWNVDEQPSLKFLSLRANALAAPPIVFYVEALFLSQTQFVCKWTANLRFLDVSANPRAFGGSSLLQALTRMMRAPPGAVASNWPFCVDAGRTSIHRRPARIGHSAPLPSISYLDLSSNRLEGRLPRTALASSFNLPYGLSTLDLSDNDFVGSIPLSFAVALATNLRFLSLHGNARMIASVTPVESFLVPDPVTERKFPLDHYACPGLTDSSRRSVVSIDPSYYRYQLCSCIQGYTGVVSASPNATTGCRTAVSYCSDGRLCATTAASSRAVQPAVGYWPAPQSSAASAFVPCTSTVNIHRTSVCNPFGNVTCVPYATEPDTVRLNCTGDLCLPGYYGRLCSQCADGYFYYIQGECRHCSSAASSKINAVTSSLMITAALTALIVLRAREQNPMRAKRRAAYHRNPSIPLFLRTYWRELLLVGILVGCITVAAASYAMSTTALMVELFLFVVVSFHFLVRSSLPLDLEAAKTSGIGTADLRTPLMANPINESTRTGTVDAHQSFGGFLGDIPLWEVRQTLAVNSGFYKVTTIWFQTMNVITLPITLPQLFSFFRVFNNGIFIVTPSICSRTSFASTYPTILVLVMLGPLIYAAFALLVFGVYACWLVVRGWWLRRSVRHRQDAQALAGAIYTRITTRLHRLLWLIISILIAILYMVYFPVLGIYLSLFSCDSSGVPGDGDLYMRAAPWIRCSRQEHDYVRMAWWGTGAMIVYTIALFYAHGVVFYAAQTGALDSLAVRTKYSILYESFRPGAWWFEMFFTARRIFVTVVLSITAPTSSFGPLAVVSVLGAELALQGWWAPFSTSLVNLAELVSLVSLIVAVLLVQAELRLFSSADQVSNLSSTDIGTLDHIIVVVISFVFLLFILLAILANLRLLPWIRKRNWWVMTVLGLGVTADGKGGVSPALRAGATTASRDVAHLLVTDDELHATPLFHGESSALRDVTSETTNLRNEIDRLQAELTQRDRNLFRVHISHEAQLSVLRDQLAAAKSAACSSPPSPTPPSL